MRGLQITDGDPKVTEGPTAHAIESRSQMKFRTGCCNAPSIEFRGAVSDEGVCERFDLMTIS